MLGVVVLVGVGAWLLLQGQAAARTAQKLAVQIVGFGKVGFKLPMLTLEVAYRITNPTLNTLHLRAITGVIRHKGVTIGVIQKSTPFSIPQLETITEVVPVTINLLSIGGVLLHAIRSGKAEEVEIEMLFTLGQFQIEQKEKRLLPVFPESIRLPINDFLYRLTKKTKGGKR